MPQNWKECVLMAILSVLARSIALYIAFFRPDDVKSEEEEETADRLRRWRSDYLAEKERNGYRLSWEEYQEKRRGGRV